MKEYDLAMQSLTPGGSEFVYDPDRCVEFVRQVRKADFEMIKRRRWPLSSTGDPHQTATSEQRRAWRASAVRYADRVEAENEHLRAALEAEAASHDALAAIGGIREPQGLARYHREHAAVLRGALAGKTEEQVRSEMEGT